MRSISQGMNSSFEVSKVENVFKRLSRNRELRNAHWRCIIGFCMSALLFYDLSSRALAYFLGLDYSLLRVAEWIITIIVLAYSLAELAVLVYGSFFVQYVDVTEMEKRLLGISDGEPGFRKSVASTPQPTNQQTIKFSPSCLGQSRLSPSTSVSSPGYIGSTPMQLDESVHSMGSFSGSFSNSFHMKSPSSVYGGSFTPPGMEGTDIRRRMSPTRYLSPDRDVNSVMSQKALDDFLSAEAAKEQRELSALADIGDPHTSSFWNVNRTVLDYIPMLRKFKYQVAPRGSQTSSTSLSNGDSDQPSKYPALELWSKLGASQMDVDMWIENLRYWIGQSVMRRLADEINKVNRELRKVGSEDTQVGEVNVSTLKNVAFVKSSLVPTLNNIIPYLEVSSNQEYLVNRIKALGNDGCIAAFNWDGGSSFNGRSWEDHLPTDSVIIIHALCTYLDARLPSNPKYPDGKAFSSQHYMSAQEKPNFEQNSDYLTLYQTKVNPPHYKVIIGKDIYDLPKGRNNTFHAILLFVHEIKANRKGMLGNVSIGDSGINMQWIMTHKYR